MANWQVISLDTTTPQLRAPGTGDGYSFNSGSTQLGVWTTTGLGIGTASPAVPLDVVSNSGSNGINIRARVANDYGFLNFKSNDGSDTAGSIAALRAGVNSGNLLFYTGLTERARLDTSGNLGLGVTPSAWGSIFKPIQLGNAFSYVAGRTDGFRQVWLGSNSYYNGTNWIYGLSQPAAQYYQNDGAHVWNTAPSGTAGNTISFTTAMTLDANGNLGIGTTSPASQLDVSKTGDAVLSLTSSGVQRYQLIARSNSNFEIYDQTAAASRVTLTQFGNFGIGTTSPAYKLDVQAASLDMRCLSTTGTNYVRQRMSNTGGDFFYGIDGSAGANFGVSYGAVLWYNGNYPMVFATNNTERARITATGQLLVNLTSSVVGEYLSVTASNSSWMARIANTNASPRGEQIIYSGASPNGTANWFLYCEDSTAQRASIRSNGGLANYQSNNVDLSDARTKKDITPAASMWDKIGALEIVTYKYNDQTHDDVNVGVIAQQVESVEPVWVDADGWGSETPEDGVPLKTVYTKDITFAAIKALQEAMARIEKLEAEVAALKGA